ncbi:MAG: GyrI-like domain-containing protein [Anaerolineaceae bacterium]|nr:GyrI-like domain-containing protein [Anaerolineaceae bacterium]
MSNQCEIVEKSDQPTLTLRTRTSIDKLPEFLGKAYGMVGQYMGENQVEHMGAPFAAFYNLDMQDLDVEAGFPVAKALPGKGEIINAIIPAGKQATLTFVGPYDQMEPAYEALNVFIKENGYQATGVCYEYYLNDPTVDPPVEPITQIVFPLKP